jgi:hypothetical protein
MVALVVCTAILAGILNHNASSGGSRIPTTIILTSTNGIPSFHGVSLHNRFVRRSLFRVFSALDYDVEITGSSGWMRNPVAKSNVWSVSEDYNEFGLSPGARAIRQREGMK